MISRKGGKINCRRLHVLDHAGSESLVVIRREVFDDVAGLATQYLECHCRVVVLKGRDVVIAQCELRLSIYLQQQLYINTCLEAHGTYFEAHDTCFEAHGTCFEARAVYLVGVIVSRVIQIVADSSNKENEEFDVI